MRKLLTCLILLASAGPLFAQVSGAPASPGVSPVAETTQAADGQKSGETDAPVLDGAKDGVTAKATDGIFLPVAPDALDELRWEKRVVAVFADSPNDPQFRRQMRALNENPAALAYRDVVVVADTDPEARSPLRETFRPRGFMLVLIGKDGQIKQRKPFPWDVRELSRTIDKTPLRQQELRDLGQRGSVPFGR